MENSAAQLTLPKAVVFDMDGVICDTREYHLLAFQELARDHGMSLTREEFQHLFGMENRKLLPTLFGKPLDDATLVRLADWKEARYRELISEDIELMAGVRELVAWLRQTGRPAAVASSAPRANVDQILRTTGLVDQLDTYLGSEDVTHHKPHPEAFLTAAERIGVPPEDCWVIEDSLHGINAGLAARMTVIAVATTHPADELAIAHAVFPDVQKLFETIGSLATTL